MNRFSLMRFPLLAAAMGMLICGLGAGLTRHDWQVPIMQTPELANLHGGLMVSGFLGTLIGLERAVALARPWAYAGPLLTAAGGVGLLLGFPPAQAIFVIALGSLALVCVFAVYLSRYPSIHLACTGSGALLWLVGNALWWHGWPMYAVAPWWMGFLLFTIAGERLELSRLLQLTGEAYFTFLSALILFLSGLAIKSFGQYLLPLVPSQGPWLMSLGDRTLGLGMVAVSVWLLYFDMARRAIGQSGLQRFVGVALLGGYGWLAASGGLALATGALLAGPIYDAILHTFMVGFVLSMIFGHGPLVFPAVLGLPITFRRFFYLPLLILYVGLLLRLVGDLAGWSEGQQWGGAANALAVVLYLLSVASTIVHGKIGDARRVSKT